MSYVLFLAAGYCVLFCQADLLFFSFDVLTKLPPKQDACCVCMQDGLAPHAQRLPSLSPHTIDGVFCAKYWHDLAIWLDRQPLLFQATVLFKQSWLRTILRKHKYVQSICGMFANDCRYSNLTALR
ncbi:hypothetical protein BCR37DRAFT_236755 [Protomyces lactucae-debilis]|uniref:Uncharacterized protein n=1 Tax=Protomyces lactucae-debilis TaxID=2754530 RepID=A0A1Y2END3_PROLT|nr:uncharacterized protein BCR37DRAFT_236755 [Protomyces lactucae-debilis]ORY73048.1 hypothetical protein BCR37DRAFT_236755 [Protomyces lactucae-debilis]